MPDLRPSVGIEAVLDLLRQNFKESIVSINQVEGGPIMRTFSFYADELEYIISFNKDNMLTSNLPKEEYISRKLSQTSIPVPTILQTGRLDELHFAISRKVPGAKGATLSQMDVIQLLPQIVATLDAIHHIDISETSGYGVFDDNGRGMTSSWRRFLELIAQEEDERDYFGKWHKLFDNSFLERDLYNEIYGRMTSLIDYYPSDRYLVHGSLSLSNILVKDARITSVLNWFDARYGDFVYDIAGLDFWYPWLDVRKVFQRHYEACKVEIPFYLQRLLCYECHVALSGLRFFAFAGNEPAYLSTKSLILQKLELGSKV